MQSEQDEMIRQNLAGQERKTGLTDVIKDVEGNPGPDCLSLDLNQDVEDFEGQEPKTGLTDVIKHVASNPGPDCLSLDLNQDVEDFEVAEVTHPLNKDDNGEQPFVLNGNIAEVILHLNKDDNEEQPSVLNGNRNHCSVSTLLSWVSSHKKIAGGLALALVALALVAVSVVLAVILYKGSDVSFAAVEDNRYHIDPGDPPVNDRIYYVTDYLDLAISLHSPVRRITHQNMSSNAPVMIFVAAVGRSSSRLFNESLTYNNVTFEVGIRNFSAAIMSGKYTLYLTNITFSMWIQVLPKDNG